MTNYPVDQLFEAPAGTGTGVMMIKTEVLNAMERPYFFHPRDPSKGMDLTFCRRAREAGFKAYCDSSILVEQMKIPGSVGFEQWMSRKEEEKMAKKSKFDFQERTPDVPKNGSPGCEYDEVPPMLDMGKAMFPKEFEYPSPYGQPSGPCEDDD
jgi:hypothetical protein